MMTEQQVTDLASAIGMILTTTQRDFTLVNGPSAVSVRIRSGEAEAVWLDGLLVGNRQAAVRQYARFVWRSFRTAEVASTQILWEGLQSAVRNGPAQLPSPAPITPPAASWTGWRWLLLWLGLCGAVWFGASWLANRLIH